MMRVPGDGIDFDGRKWNRGRHLLTNLGRKWCPPFYFLPSNSIPSPGSHLFELLERNNPVEINCRDNLEQMAWQCNSNVYPKVFSKGQVYHKHCFKCNVCQSRYTKACILENHIRSIHIYLFSRHVVYQNLVLPNVRLLDIIWPLFSTFGFFLCIYLYLLTQVSVLLVH